QSLALAALEMLVHLQSQQILDSYLAAAVTFEAAQVKRLDRAKLPDDWRADPPPVVLRQLGDQWVANQESAVLRVPSAVIEAEDNFLLNPNHPDFDKIVISPPEPFHYDPRLARS